MRLGVLFMVCGALLTAGCSWHGPLDAGTTAQPAERYLNPAYITPNYQENVLFDGFAPEAHPEDLRYQLAFFHGRQVQYNLHKLIRDDQDGQWKELGNVGNVQAVATPSGGLYYDARFKRHCRQLKLRWLNTANGQRMSDEELIFCQLGPEFEWLPLGS